MNKTLEAQMHNLIAAVGMGGFATAYTLFAASLSSSTDVTLGEALASFVFIGGIIWWLGRKLQNIEDKIENLPCKKCDRHAPENDDQ